MKKIIIPILFLIVFQANAQITLEQCYEGLQKNFPSLKTKKDLKRQYSLEIDKLSNNWLPQFQLNAQATYQSDVTKVDVNMPEIQIPGLGQSLQIPDLNIPTPDKDQYKINLNLSQMIYDGGLVTIQKDLQKSKLDLNIQSIEINFQDLKLKVNNLFFNILTLQKSIDLIDLTLKNLEEKRKVIESLVNNGVLIKAELQNFDSEILKIKQKKIELEYNKSILIQSLSLLTGMEINNASIFKLPESELIIQKNIETPQHKLFNLQQELNKKSSKLSDILINPKIIAFAQIGYGKPGLNMLSNEFNPFYIIGIQFSWKLWDWNNSNKDKQISELRNSIIDKNKQSYDIQLKTELNKELTNIKKFDEIISNDKNIVALKKDIIISSNSKLENGVIKTSDYFEDVNNELKAKIELEIHKIQKLQSTINYKTLLGN